MSKIGRKPIRLEKVKVEVKGKEVHYNGPKSSGVYHLPEAIDARVEDNALFLAPVKLAESGRGLNRIWGLHRALISNKIHGAGEGFERKLQIVGLGYRAAVSGKRVVLSLGFSHKIEIDLPESVSLEVDKTGQLLTFKSPDRELVGQVCSKIRSLRPPEPYKGTGVKWITEVILRKAGKAKAT